MTHRFAAATTEIWSATPTPLFEDLSLDPESINRMVEHHVMLGVNGVMLGGTCGEGPWMPLDDLLELTRRVVRAAGGRLRVAVQITDNSTRRMLNHIERLVHAGADYAVVASPYFLMNTSPRRLLDLYLQVIRRSPLPIGFYDRGFRAAQYLVEKELLPELLAEPNLKLVKDSSVDPERRAVYLQAGSTRSDLSVFTGDEFQCVEPLAEGYDGLLLGGGIFNGRLADGIVRAVSQGRIEEARRIQERMNELMFRVYGGPNVTCWLTGLKYLLVRLQIFSSTSSYLDYPLTPECRNAIEEITDGEDADGYLADLLAKETVEAF